MICVRFWEWKYRVMIEIVPDRLDFEERDREQAQWLERRPRCSCCGEHIQDDSAVQIRDDFYCDNCLDDMRVCIED